MTEGKTIERVSGHGANTEFRVINHQGIDSEEEFVPQMNAQGKILGSVLKSEAHKHPEIIHAGVGIFVIDPEVGEIFLPKRASTKSKDPNCLDFSTGEHVKILDNQTGKAETWEQAAHRGIKEELKQRGAENEEITNYTLERIPGHILDTNDPKETERRTFYVVQLSKKRGLFADDKESDPLGGGWFSISDLLEIADGTAGKANPLQNQQIRPMLLNDLKRPEVRKSLEKFLENQSSSPENSLSA